MRALACLVAAVALFSGLLRAQGELVVVKDGTSQYHRPGCPVIRDGKGLLAMTRAQAEGRKYTPHPACDPERPPSTVVPGSTPPAGKPAPPEFVFVDAGGKLYHRETCKRLGKEPKKLAVDQAGRKYWPCTVCKPPIRKRPGSK